MIEPTAERLVRAAADLSASVERMAFSPPVKHVYNPLVYAWAAHQQYVRLYGNAPKRVLFLGMNPGPFGMAQTGIPFGEVPAVRDWLKIDQPIGKPAVEHPKRPVLGFGCGRSEVSGRRLWGLFARRFGSAQEFFVDHFVANYCPLVFMESTGCNRTPDKLSASELSPLLRACDAHLKRVADILQPEWLIGVGGFAERRARIVFEGVSLRIGGILHPSPASPASNRDWEGVVTKQLCALGVWGR